MNKVCLITGGTSGIGLSTVKTMLGAGYTVYEFSRRAEGVTGTNHFSVDITDENAVQSAVQKIYDAEGRLDVVINCAGCGISGAIEFTKSEDAHFQFDVNFFGMVNINKAVLGIMRRQGYGRIVNTSSVAAPIAIPFQAYYSATKSAINTYTLALANEVRPYGVTVCAVQPGDIKTGFTAARRKSNDGDDEYCGRISKSVAVMEHDEQNGMSPDAAGAFIGRIAQKKRVKAIYTIGFKYKLFCVIAKLLPTTLVNFLVGKIYA